MAKIESEYDVATVLGSLDTARWGEVREAIRKGGTGYAFGPELDFGEPPEGGDSEAEYIFNEASEIAGTNRLMRQVGRSLHGNLDEALRRVAAAQRNIQELRDLGDIEFLEGNGDVELFLKDAARMLRAAREMKHTDETGETK